MRVSGGREVTDLSGKMRIHSLPLRFMLRVRATRAASSCVFVIQARSSVCSPNSPKSILRLREAVPLRLPRWDLRYFTRFGINGMAFFSLKFVQGPATAVVMALMRPPARVLLPFYKSNISRRFCHKPCWLRQIRNRFRSAVCGEELCLRDTIPSARSPRHLRNFFRHLLDLRAFASDDDARTCRENCNANTVPRAFDHNFRNRGELQLLLHITANLQIAMQKRRQLLRRGVPARAPVAIHTKAKSNWINFLSHKLLFRFLSRRFFCLWRFFRGGCRFLSGFTDYCVFSRLFLFLFSFLFPRFPRFNFDLIA